MFLVFESVLLKGRINDITHDTLRVRIEYLSLIWSSLVVDNSPTRAKEKEEKDTNWWSSNEDSVGEQKEYRDMAWTQSPSPSSMTCCMTMMRDS